MISDHLAGHIKKTAIAQIAHHADVLRDRDRMATLNNESVCGASFNKFSLLQELSGTDADRSLEFLNQLTEM